MKEAYQEALKKIRPTETLQQRTLNEMQAAFRGRKDSRKRWWKVPMVIAICGVCLLGSLPVMAAFVPGFAEIVSLISPNLARMLTPVQLSCTDNGIRMQVEAVVQDEEEIVAFLTMQDLEGDRIDDSIDLYNYIINGYTTFTHQVIDYNEKEKKAVLELRAFCGDEDVPSGKTTVHIQSFLSGRKEYSDVPIKPDVRIKEITEVLSLEVANGGGSLLAELDQRKDRTISILRPGERLPLRDDIDFVYLTGAGFVDGRLHIQTWWVPSVDNHGFLELRNGQGEIIDASNVSFRIAEDGTAIGVGENDARLDYIEYIFDISPEELNDYDIYGTFFVDSVYTEGNWHVSFPSDTLRTITLTQKELPTLAPQIKQIVISPLSVTLTGDEAYINDLRLHVDQEKHLLELNADNLSSSHAWSDGENVAKIQLEADSFIDLDQIDQLKIKEQVISIPTGK